MSISLSVYLSFCLSICLSYKIEVGVSKEKNKPKTCLKLAQLSFDNIFYSLVIIVEIRGRGLGRDEEGGEYSIL